MKKTQKTMKNILSFLFCVPSASLRTGLCSVLCLLLLISCATAKPSNKSVSDVLPEIEKKSDLTAKEPSIETKSAELKISDYVPVNEDITPLQTKVVSISARNTPLRDVLYTIAEAVNLNLVMESGVKPDLPVTMTLNNMVVQDALNIIFNSVDYFYTIKDNILIVKAVDTKIFELGQPNTIQDYQTDIGGDILGGASSGESGGAIKGDISMQSTSDKVSFQFWDAIENSLKTLVPVSTKEEETLKTSFTINRMAGIIMVTAPKKQLEHVENYINNLKKTLNRQVFIEARIVEVQLSEGLKYGIDWSFIEDWQGVGNINIGPTNFSSIVEGTGPNFQISLTGKNFTSLLKALQEQGDVKTLSNPRVNILNGQTALLSVGRNTSFISKVESTTSAESGAATTSFTIETKSVLSGIIFGLVPYISGEGEITMTITPIVSNLVSLDSKTIGSGTNTVEIKLPTVDLREMSSTVKLLDGQMVVIGGLIDSKEKFDEDKVPVLSDIPILGNLFKRVDKSYAKTELVIMLMPKIIQ